MTLTGNQQAQVNKAPQAQKAALRAMYERQKQNQQKTRTRPQPKRTPARRTVANVPRPLGYAFDGFDKRHLPLDELTAPYTTTNFLSLMEFGSATDMDQVIVICMRKYYQQETYLGPLTDYIAMRYDANETIGATTPVLQSIRSPIIDIPTVNANNQLFSTRARLHNMSVRLECLGTNTGLYPPGSVFLGTVPMIENGLYGTGAVESLTIKQAWAEDSISVGYLRSVPSASLVEKPVSLHSAIAENMAYKAWNDFTVPSLGVEVGSLPLSTALEPIVIYIPRAGAGDTVVNYRVEIGQQWCSRHPHNVLLRSTQKQHPATAPGVWHQAVAAVKDVGEHVLQRAAGAAANAIAARIGQANPIRAIANMA